MSRCGCELTSQEQGVCHSTENHQDQSYQSRQAFMYGSSSPPPPYRRSDVAVTFILFILFDLLSLQNEFHSNNKICILCSPGHQW